MAKGQERVQTERQSSRPALNRQSAVHPQPDLTLFQLRRPMSPLTPGAEKLVGRTRDADQNQSAPKRKQGRAQREQPSAGIVASEQKENQSAHCQPAEGKRDAHRARIRSPPGRRPQREKKTEPFS